VSESTARGWRLERIDGPGARFERAYGVLADEFAARGELERRAVIEGWLARDAGGAWTYDRDGRAQRYWLIEALTASGELAAVRDCHVIVDAPSAIAVVYLAHVVVLPAHRRAGLASLLRELPITLARQALTELPVPAPAEIVLAAEMERPRLDDRDSLVRLVAYGRAGFAVIDPAALPYAQPDFREPAVIDDAPRPVPLLAVVRRVGREGAPTLPRRLARAYQLHLDAVFATHCLEAHLAPRREQALSALAAHASEEVPLLALPAHLDDEAAFARLVVPSATR
jgi:GNAT superfamily N-acetyltransferase